MLAINGQHVLRHVLAITNHLGIQIEVAGDLDHIGSNVFLHVQFHAMAHIEHLVHFFPGSAAFGLNQREYRRCREQTVLNHMQVADKVHHLGLRTARAMDDAMDAGTVVLQDSLDDRRVRTGRGQQQLPYIHAFHTGRVGQGLASGIHQVVRNRLVVGFRILLGIGMLEHVMTSRSQAIAADTARVLAFVSRLAERRQTDKYLEDLELLQYDILYGEQYVYGDGEMPVKEPHMVMGVRDVSLTDIIEKLDKGCSLYGENFTKQSKVFVNGTKQSSKFLNNTRIDLPETDLEDGDVIYVVQMGSSNTVFRKSNEYIYKDGKLVVQEGTGTDTTKSWQDQEETEQTDAGN